MDTPSGTPTVTWNHPASSLHQDTLKSDYYLLEADYHGTTRLALQHYIWQQSLGFDVHPSIPKLDSPSVADVACGTGLWLVDVGRRFGPSSELHGFDTNLGQAPPQQWLPANMKLHHWDVYDDVPAEFVGKFDLVHVRLITIIIKENNSKPVIQNLCKLLKPGGYLQWDEVDHYNSFCIKAHPDLQVPAMDAWVEWIRGRKPAVDWKEDVVTQLKGNGFASVEQHELRDKFLENLPLMRYNNDQFLMLYEQLAKRMFVAGHEVSSELSDIIRAASKDAELGSAMVMPPTCWVARKSA